MERDDSAPSTTDPHLRLLSSERGSTMEPLDPALSSTLRDEWELDAVPCPARFMDDPAARPVAVLIGSGELIVHCKMVDRPPAEPDELARLLAREVDAATSTVQRAPRRVAVRHATVAEPLRELLRPRGIAVRSVRRLTNLDVAARGLVAHLSGRENAPMASMPETWAGWDLPRDAIARLFRAAAAYYRARPWQYVADDRPIAATLADGTKWYAVILGNAGQEFGLALYSDPEDLATLYRERDPERVFLGVRGTLFSITFAAKDDLPLRMRRAVKSAGWEIAGPAAYPLPLVMGTPGGGVRQHQIDQMITLLRAVPRFVTVTQRDGPGRPGAAEGWTDEESGTVLRFDRDLAPMPEMLWDPPDRLTPSGPVGRGARPDDTVRTMPDEARAALIAETLDRFVQHAQRNGRVAAISAKAAHKHARAIWLFLQFLTEYHGIGPSAVTEFDLRMFLYDWYPRKVMDSEQDARSLLGSLRRFFAFLAEAEGIECPWADAVLRNRDAFLAMWYGPCERDPDAANEDWLEPLRLDLGLRVLMPANDAESGFEWGAMMEVTEATLFDQVQRLWLRWRDEVIRGGTTNPDAVHAALRERQGSWLNTPNALVGGKTPLQAVTQERQRAKN